MEMIYGKRKYDKEKSFEQNKLSDEEYIELVTKGEINDVFYFIQKCMHEEKFFAAQHECYAHIRKIESVSSKVNKNVLQSNLEKRAYASELNAVEAVREAYGDAAVLRRKDNGKIKYGKGVSRFKKLIYRWRYRQEREAAARYFPEEKKGRKKK